MRPRSASVSFELADTTWSARDVRDYVRSVFAVGALGGGEIKGVVVNIVDATKGKKKAGKR